MVLLRKAAVASLGSVEALAIRLQRGKGSVSLGEQSIGFADRCFLRVF